MLCSVPLSDVKAKSPRWRFNISLLSNQTFITSLKEYIKEFLEINMPSEGEDVKFPRTDITLASTIWQFIDFPTDHQTILKNKLLL